MSLKNECDDLIVTSSGILQGTMYATLSIKQRQAMMLYVERGMKQGEIARIMGIKRESVNRLIARARKILKALARELILAGCDCDYLLAML